MKESTTVKKYVVSVILGLFFLAPLVSSAFTSEHPGCGGDCKECHSMEKKEAEGIVKKGIPNGSVTDVKMAAVPGLWQIDFDAEGKHGTLFVDFAKKHLLVVQQIVSLEDLEKTAVPRSIEFSKLPLKEALVMGPKNAKKKVAVFTDPDCPYCQKLHWEIKQILAKRHDVAFYIFLRPLPMHGKDANDKAQAILCEQSLALLDDALSGKSLPGPSCTTAGAQIEKNSALADSLGLRGTPTLVREDGIVNFGALPAEQLSAWIDGK
jgi:thiol:disulfide interchange protein DsbC